MRPRSTELNPDASATREESKKKIPLGEWIRPGTRMVRRTPAPYAKNQHAILGWDLGGPMIGLLFEGTDISIPEFRQEWQREDELADEPPVFGDDPP